MQTTVHKMDSTSRYNNNETVSSHGGAGTFVGNNGGYRGNESSRGLNQNSYGAQFSASADNKTKNQNYGCENDSNTESPYSGWQSLNSSVNTSSATNNWNIPDGKPVMGRSIHGNRENSVNKEENMAVDNESSFSGLLGATGGSEEKSNSSNNFTGNSSRSMHVPRLGLLGGGESNLVSQPSAWNGNQGPNSSAWGGSARQNNNSSDPNSDNMLVDGDMNFNGMLNATSGSESKQNGSNNYRQDHTIPPPRMGLLGGGEGTASSGWVNSNTSGNGGNGWTSNARTSTNNSVTDLTCSSSSGNSAKPPQGSWAQAAGKGLSSSSLPPNSLNGSSGQQGSSTTLTSESSGQHEPSAPGPRDRAEQEAKEFQLKAAFSEGWGQNSVNQDSPWEVPITPPPENGKESQSSAVWRAPVNMGTEIWENNLRMNKGSGGSSVPAQTTTQPPWGHTPASNIGGHWGDDDSSNMWSGVPPPNSAPNPANWSDSSVANSNMWGNTVPSEKHWGGSQSSWGDGACGSEGGSSVWTPSNKSRPISNWSPIATPKKEMPPSGWEPPSPPPNRRPVGGSGFDDGTAVWGNPQRQGKVSHWKDMPSAKPIMNSNSNIVGPNGMLGNMAGMPQSGPGMIRLPQNKNDASFICKGPPPSNRGGSNWQDMPPHRDSPTAGNWGEDSHMHNQMKGISGMQGGNGPYGGVGSWNDQSNNSMQYWGAKPKSNCNWADGQVDTSSWLGPAKQVRGHNGGKPLCKDIVHASKQFRILTELGFRKEDVENALRNNNMNLDEALVELQAMQNGVMDVDGFAGRKVRPANMYDDMPVSDNNLESNFSSNNFHGSSNFQSALNINGVVGHSFKHQQTKGPSGSSNLMNSTMGGGQQSNSGSVGNLSPALVQKLLQQQQQQQQQQQSFQLFNVNNVQAFGNMKFPTNSHLRHLVQQIQMAVQAGHLNAQILNQPLAPQTLQFLYQLLQQIKVLTQLQQQQMLQSSHMPKQGVPNATQLQLNVQIAQTKQRINNLQNQICANQALYLKQIPQQQNPLQPPHHASQVSADLFKAAANMETMPALHSEFRDLSLKDMPHQNAQQSRLNQWKLSSAGEKEDNNPMCPPNDLGIPDFSRAPGSMNSKVASSVPSSGSALHPLLDQNDANTWSGLAGRSHGDSGWPEVVSSSTDSANGSGTSAAPVMGSNGGQPTDNKDSTPVSGSYNLTDLVPEFEPGKPWKGTQLKNIEDDPHITPGSIARSPLSVNNIKESNLFWPSKTSPGNSSSDASSSLTSSTWGFPSSSAGPNSAGGSVKSGSGKSGWGSDFGAGSDLWGSVSKSRNPPPGIANQGWERPQNSTFLILRNLTPQIDGSTLKTLCMQHGPLQMFHLFQNGGVALVRYSTREEASKAQSALNNCVLGNTTMLADIPSDSEIQQYLQVSSGQQANNNTTWSSSAGSSSTGGSGGGSSTFHGGSSAFYGSGSGGSSSSNWNGNVSTSQLWPFSNSSLWGSTQPSSDHDASTNPMNSYLPGDLLGGEPM